MANLKSRYSAGDSWSREPQRTLPFSAEMGSRSKQYSPDGGCGRLPALEAGSRPATASCSTTRIASSSRMVHEAGPGTFGEKQWATLNSFEYKKDWAMYLRRGTRRSTSTARPCKEMGLDDKGRRLRNPPNLSRGSSGRLPAPDLALREAW